MHVAAKRIFLGKRYNEIDVELRISNDTVLRASPAVGFPKPKIWPGEAHFPSGEPREKVKFK
jgi:hypothetical protein